MKNILFYLLIFISIYSCSTKFEDNIDNDSSINIVDLKNDFQNFDNLNSLEPYKFEILINDDEYLTKFPINIKYNIKRNTLFVLDIIENKIFEISCDGELLNEIGKKGEAVNELFMPIDFDFDTKNNLYILDNQKIKVFSMEGIENNSFIVKGFPWRLMLFNDEIYVISTIPVDENIILKYNLNGNVIDKYIEGRKNADPDLTFLENQSIMTYDEMGNFYFAFSNEYRIIKIDNEGNLDSNYIIGNLPYDIVEIHKRKNPNDKMMSIVIMDLDIDNEGNLFVLWGEDLGYPYCRVDVYDNTGLPKEVIKLSVPSPGDGVIPTSISNIVIVNHNIYACEIYTDGLIYKYNIDFLYE